jgi:hypothetical protein
MVVAKVMSGYSRGVVAIVLMRMPLWVLKER